jgi:hypothetical protein
MVSSMGMVRHRHGCTTGSLPLKCGNRAPLSEAIAVHKFRLSESLGTWAIRPLVAFAGLDKYSGRLDHVP